MVVYDAVNGNHILLKHMESNRIMNISEFVKISDTVAIASKCIKIIRYCVWSRMNQMSITNRNLVSYCKTGGCGVQEVRINRMNLDFV
jgi:hypothetical protein